MAEIEGYIGVYESSDGGTGNPTKTIWQFFVGIQPVSTENHCIAETMRLAIKTSSKVKVIYDPDTHTISQARIIFKYICVSQKIEECAPNQPGQTKFLCETKRLAPCDQEDSRTDANSETK